MTALEKVEHHVASPGRLSRRTLIGRTAKFSFGLAAAAVGAGVLAKPAYSATCCNLCSDCCGWSVCPSADSCPAGCTTYEWMCTSGSCHWICGECCADQCGGNGCSQTCKCSYSYPLCGVGCPCSPQTAKKMEGITAKELLYTRPLR